MHKIRKENYMEKYFNGMSLAIGLVGGGLAYVLGGWDILLWTLTAFVVLDYVTGLIRAAKMKELSSENGPGSFEVHFLDELYKARPEDIANNYFHLEEA